jgi:hypothetical protein
LRYLFKKRKTLRLYQKFPGLIKKDSSQVVGKNGQKVSSPEGRFCQITRHITVSGYYPLFPDVCNYAIT